MEVEKEAREKEKKREGYQSNGVERMCERVKEKDRQRRVEREKE